jgi:hypothetical protein
MQQKYPASRFYRPVRRLVQPERARGMRLRNLETDDPGNGKITIAKIKTSDADKLLAVYKNQWTGTRDITAGNRTTFNLTVDGKCGNNHIFKFIRQNGLTCYATSACGRTVTCDDDNWD